MNTTILQLEHHAIEVLSPIYGQAEARAITRRLLEETLQIDQTALLLLDKDTALSESTVQRLGNMLSRLRQSEPLQYVLGYTYFYGYKVAVAPGVLIPRPETEELVDLVRSHTHHMAHVRCLDIGTGSGCIALGLASIAGDRPWHIEALEYSSDAIKVAQANFYSLKSIRNKEIHLMQGDLFAIKHTYPQEAYDILVSNPPYITQEEGKEMQKHVLQYEPHEALFAPSDNAIAYYEEIAHLANDPRWLSNGGMVFLEINPMFAQATVASIQTILGDKIKDLQCLRDLSGKERFIIVRLQSI